MNIVALSGGKDSTALALRLAEVEPHVPTEYLITPTGDELPEMRAHWDALAARLGKPLTVVSAHTLASLIESFNALPNFRQRWCTRMIKIEPCIAWLVRRAAERPDMVLCVGLRADEEERKGLYSEHVVTRFPLREWGWGIDHVRGYLKVAGIVVPARTDCARCYHQKIGEWFLLWRDYPAIWADAEAQEGATGHTFRSPGRDTWPVPLAALRAEFERGRAPARSLKMMQRDADACRVCSM